MTQLVDGRHLFLNVGGTDGAGIVAFDKDTGKVLWQATDNEASYSSPVMANFGERPQVVFFTREGLLLLDPESGEILYQSPAASALFDEETNQSGQPVSAEHIDSDGRGSGP